MEARAEHQTKQKFKAVYGVSTGLGIILAVLLLAWLTYFRGGFAWRSNPAQEFYWHPLLMVFGLVCLYSQCKHTKFTFFPNKTLNNFSFTHI